MIFKVTDIKFYCYPNKESISRILNEFNTHIQEIEAELKKTSFIRNNENQGFQIELGKQLGKFFKIFFINKGFNAYTSPRQIRYSPNIDLRADVAVKRKNSNKGIYIEIEFRPNEFKDIVKFEIGHNNNYTELGILIVAQNRDHINPSYTTMPQFNKCKKIIEELKPRCPTLLIGIDGNWKK